VSDLLAIGASGIKAYGQALSVVGDNIANAQTDGYVRRSVRLAEAPSGGDIVLSRNSIRPGGVLAAGVTRAVDQWLTDDARIAGGEASRQSAKLDWITATESALADGGAGIGNAVTAVFTAAEQLSGNPSSDTLRRQFLSSVDESAATFRRTAAALGSAAEGVISEAKGAATQLNTDLIALSRINDGLRRARAGSTNEATLLDERDRLIGNISSAIDVTVSYDARGAAIVKRPAGDSLLDGAVTATISLTIAADGTISFGINPGGAGILTPASGTLAGLTDAANHLSGQRSALDTLAAQFAADLNAAHRAGVDANGNAGMALLSMAGGAASLIAMTLAPGEVAAANAASANGNMLGLNGLRGNGGAEAGWINLVAAQAQTTAATRAQEAAASSRRDGSFAARDALGAVDLDREAAELLRFQQAYEAAARTIQVARETMQSLLSIF
jgi:flagellar hook-associated protein 1